MELIQDITSVKNIFFVLVILQVIMLYFLIMLYRIVTRELIDEIHRCNLRIDEHNKYVSRTNEAIVKEHQRLYSKITSLFEYIHSRFSRERIYGLADNRIKVDENKDNDEQIKNEIPVDIKTHQTRRRRRNPKSKFFNTKNSNTDVSSDSPSV